MADEFWTTIREQLKELESAKSAEEVVHILSRERNPYGSSVGMAGDGFFAGSGGDNTVWDALEKAGWNALWVRTPYYYAMTAPDGSVITYIEGDIYLGNRD